MCTEKKSFYQFIQSLSYTLHERSAMAQAQVTYTYFNMFFYMYQILKTRQALLKLLHIWVIIDYEFLPLLINWAFYVYLAIIFVSVPYLYIALKLLLFKMEDYWVDENLYQRLKIISTNNRRHNTVFLCKLFYSYTFSNYLQHRLGRGVAWGGRSRKKHIYLTSLHCGLGRHYTTLFNKWGN